MVIGTEKDKDAAEGLGNSRETVRTGSSDNDDAGKTVEASSTMPPTATGKDSTSHKDLIEFKSEDSESDSESDEEYLSILNRFSNLLGKDTETCFREPVLPSLDLRGVAKHISSGKAKNIVVMCGAGISVNAGIPDFRTPGTGLYSRLEEYNLPHPTAVFEIDYFRQNPHPFFLLAKELFPGKYAPTATHYFIRLLHDKGILQRCYTQNIDSLEHLAGLPKDAVIAAHGNFDAAQCIDCQAEHDMDYVKDAIDSQIPARCISGKKKCRGLVKPSIVFFGENLPSRFFNSLPEDFEKADFLIVLGTSLVVQPFASLVDRVNENVPRVLVNMERVGEAPPELRSLGYSKGFNFGEGNYRDVLYQGDCDAGIKELCRLLGWEDELEQTMNSWKPSLNYSSNGAETSEAFDAALVGGWSKSTCLQEEDVGPAIES